MMRQLPLLLSCSLALAGCALFDDDGTSMSSEDVPDDGDSDDGMDPEPEPEPEPDPNPEPTSGKVFAISNSAEGNGVVMLDRGTDGMLSMIGTFPTGGLGTGSGIGSQSAMAVSDDGNYLYVINPGSDDISAFQIFDDHLSLISITDSGGERPVSVTLRGNRLYAVNAGDSSVSGYAVEDGWLIQIAGASATLSTMEATAPAQIGLSPDGKLLVVTEKATNAISVYQVALGGDLEGPTVTASQGMTPFGFDFSGDALIVSEAFGGEEAASAASSYRLNKDGTLTTITSSLPSQQSAACWVVVSQDGETAYTTNTDSDTISGYHIDSGANLSLPTAGDRALINLGPERGPIDMDLVDDAYLYVLNGKADSIVGLRVDDGNLEEIDEVNVPATTVGLLAL